MTPFAPKLVTDDEISGEGYTSSPMYAGLSRYHMLMASREVPAGHQIGGGATCRSQGG